MKMATSAARWICPPALAAFTMTFGSSAAEARGPSRTRSASAPAASLAGRLGMGGRAPPHAAAGFRDEAQLGPLLVLGEEVAFHRGGEAALGAEREVLQGDVAGRRLDPPRERVAALELRPLAAHEAEHHRPALRDEPQRLETPRPLLVVLQPE